MFKIKRFNEIYTNVYNYEHVTKLIKSHGWGMGSIQFTNEFEENSEYFKDPIGDNDYAEQFHIYLTDKKFNRVRTGLNRNYPLRVGKWQMGTQVTEPVSFYNKLT